VALAASDIAGAMVFVERLLAPRLRGRTGRRGCEAHPAHLSSGAGRRRRPRAAAQLERRTRCRAAATIDEPGAARQLWTIAEHREIPRMAKQRGNAREA
jgi:hypothetical protein